MTIGISKSPTSEVKPVSLSESADLAKRQEMFVAEKPLRKLQDLVLSVHTREQIIGLLTKIRHHRLLYETFGLNQVDPRGGRTAINFYGPPGTGKTLAAEVLASELGLRLIRANYAEIESKFVGETPKNIRAAFLKAEQGGALLFFDEADSILGKRLSNVSQSTDHAVNLSRSVMLMQLDQFNGVVVFATNLASNYDPAFVRRILGHVEMPLPNAEVRALLWRSLIPSPMPVHLSDADRTRLVNASDGFAGGDILNAIINAAAQAIQRGGVNCVIRVEDFAWAIEIGKKAKIEIGVTA
jgi:SpoVK/Ycf46/Vps4 family AAA+-type ATPase